MAVDTQLLELPFQSGIDQKVDPRWLTIGNQSSVINGVFKKAGAITKRFGYTALPSNTDQTSPDDDLTTTRAFLKLGGSIAVTASTVANAQTDAVDWFAYSPTIPAATGRWRDQDKNVPCLAWREDLIEWPLAMINFDIAYANGFVIVVWTALQQGSVTVNSSYINVIDASNGTYAISSLELKPSAGGVTAVRVVAGGTKAVVITKEGGGTATIHTTVIDLAAMSVGAPAATFTDWDTTAASDQLWDASWVNGNAAAFVVFYPRRAAGVSLSKLTYNTISGTVVTVAGSVNYPAVGAHNQPGHGFAVTAQEGENIWTACGYDDGANTDIFMCARAATAALTLVIAETSVFAGLTGTASIRIAVGRYTSTKAVAIFSPLAAPSRWRTLTTTGTVGGTGILYQHIVGGKPFVYNGFMFCPMACTSNLVAFDELGTVQTAGQGAYNLVQLNIGYETAVGQCGMTVACLGPRLANTTGSTYSANIILPNTYAIDSNNFIGIGTYNGSTSTRFNLNELHYSFAGNRFQSVELGEVAYINGGVLHQYDGQRFTEVGFLHPPPGALSLTPSNAGGGLTNNGVYTYYVLYTWPDARGQIQRSAASAGTVTLGVADNKVTLIVQNVSNTFKQDADSSWNPNIGIQVYRNQNGGATFYQVFSDVAVGKSAPYIQSTTIADTISDANLVSQNFGILPSQGGALEGYTPGSVQLVVKHRDRLWMLLDDRVTWGYTTEVIVGEQVRYNDNFTTVMPEGPVVAGASMDSIFYSWTRDGIWAIAGNGPNQNGEGNDLQSPQRIPSEVGCIDPRSICPTSLGVFFQSITGIHLLTRGREVVYVGQAVEDSLATYPIIKAATLVPRHTEVRFACHTTETSGVGVELVYNYTFKAWSVFDRLSTKASQHAIVCADDYYWMDSSAGLYVENHDSAAVNAYKDGTSWVPLTVVSAWAHPSSVLGYNLFQYVNVLGVNNDPHDLTVSMAIDYSESYGIVDLFTAFDMQTWTTPLAMAQAQVADQMAAALRVKISDASPTGISATTGRGPTLVGLQIQVGNLGGPYRTPIAQGA